MAHAAPLGKPDPAHDAWRRYYHYQRLERHGQPQSWHGNKGWGRALLMGLVLLALAAYGFRHFFASPYSPLAPTVAGSGIIPTIPSGIPEPAKPSHAP